MDEFDRLGREAFLEKHGFGASNRYFVKRNNKSYDSKAIYGSAHQLQFPEDGPMRSADFSGGHRAVQQPLEALGYEFEVSLRNEEEVAALGEPGLITSEDVHLIAKSRAKERYADLSEEEHAAYVRTSEALQFLGDFLKSKLKNSARFEVRTTSGFNIKSGVEPPHLNWSTVMFRKRRTENGEQTTQARGNSSEAAAG